MNQDHDIITKSQESLKNRYMNAAFVEAKKAFDKNEVPVGAVVVFEGKIISRAHNLRESSQLFFAHAEFLAMMKASKKLKSWRLDACDIYVTMEPCPMCAGAMVQSRVRKVYYATKDLKSGVVDSIIKMFDLPFNHKVDYEGSKILVQENQDLLKSFFKKLRNK